MYVIFGASWATQSTKNKAKWSQNGGKNRSKIDEKLGPRGSGLRFGAAWAAGTEKGGCGGAAGRHLGSILEPNKEAKEDQNCNKNGIEI